MDWPGNSNIIEKRVREVFILLAGLWLISFILPAFGLLNSGFLGYEVSQTDKVLYGYQCFYYSLFLPLAAIAHSYLSDFLYSSLGLIPNFTLIVLFFLLAKKMEWKLNIFSTIALIIVETLSICYWSCWEPEYGTVELKPGFYLWAITTLLLTVISILWLKIKSND